MKTFKFLSMLLCAGAFVVVAPATARAESGVAISSKSLGVKPEAELKSAIAKARAANPAAFKRVERLPAAVEKLDKARRGRFASVSRELWHLGKPALLPMLEMLAVKGPARGNMTDTAWTTLRVSLIEAVGMHRDPVAVPVLGSILDHETEHYVVRAAAEALGRIGDDASAKKLAELATAPGPKQAAVLSGIADCRRAVAVSRVAKFLESPTDYETTKLALRSLGSMGSSWAWQTANVKKSGEESSVRPVAAEALVRAFARFEDKELRLAAQKAILMVDDPSTPNVIESVKSQADAETRSALELLAKKFAANPVRKYQ
ncbi:MAG: HEAT repeat domain-containing protein [Polyangiaceae bacterium]